MTKSSYPGAVPVDKNDAYLVRGQLMNVLQNLGMSKAIQLVEEASKNSDGHYYSRFMFKVVKTGKTYNTLEEAIDAVKASATGLGRSRERNVDPNAEPVSIKKRDPLGYSWESGKRASGDFETSLSIEGNARRSSADGRKKSRASKRIRHSDVLELVETHGENELEHYGRKGMKWGQHIFGEDKMFSKASSTLRKLDTRAAKSEERANKLYEKTLRRQERANNALVFKKSRARRAAKSTRKLAQVQLRIQQRTAKAKKFYDAMEASFGNEKISELRNTDIGKKYAEMTINDMMSNTAASSSMIQLASYYENRSRR